MGEFGNIEKLNEELMKLLESRDTRALDVIDELKRQGSMTQNDSLLGYAYYRYAYYYYFTAQDMRMFRVYLQQAIRYLIRGGNKEYLGGAYNLVAYDAQDQGSLDIAYAYFMTALKTTENEEGISLPGLIESSVGRLLTELGSYDEAMERLKSAMTKLEKVTNMHVYNYNMIVSYADVALTAFLMGDESELRDALDKIEEYYQLATAEEKTLSRSYYLLPHIYLGMMTGDDEQIESGIEELFGYWRGMTAADLLGLMLEIESMFSFMMEHDYISQAEELLEIASVLADDDNSLVAIRYYNLKINYCEKIHDYKNVRESLRAQHEAQKKRKEDTSRMMKYYMEFADMTGEIAREHSTQLQI